MSSKFYKYGYPFDIDNLPFRFKEFEVLKSEDGYLYEFSEFFKDMMNVTPQYVKYKDELTKSSITTVLLKPFLYYLEL